MMLNRRDFLKTTAATGFVVAMSGVAIAAPLSKLIGHAFCSIDDVISGRIARADVEVIYLTEASMRRYHETEVWDRFNVDPEFDLPPDWWTYDAAYKAQCDKHWAHLEERKMHLTELKADFDAIGLIQPRPSSMGPVGRNFWTRDGEVVAMPWDGERRNLGAAYRYS